MQRKVNAADVALANEHRLRYCEIVYGRPAPTERALIDREAAERGCAVDGMAWKRHDSDVAYEMRRRE